MRHSTKRFSAQGRRTTWAQHYEQISLGANGDYATWDLLSQFKADGGVQQAATVTRTHMLVSIESPVAPGDWFYLGLVRGQNTDVGVNVAGAPVPDTDPYEDWLLSQGRYASNYDTAGSFGDWGIGNVIRVDLKAQRRLEELQMSYNCVIKLGSAATLPFVVNIFTRTLLKLP